MTIMDALGKVDALKHNDYSQTEKIAWLSSLDGMVKKQIIDAHEGGAAVSFTGYTADTLPDTVLLIPEPFDDIYLRWLEAQIDYHNGEYGKYNNAIEMFNTAWENYRNFYTRNNMPKTHGIQYF